MNATYLATARLLTEIAPEVFKSRLFALKGGTAINLFLREMPAFLSISTWSSLTIARREPTRSAPSTTRCERPRTP